MNKITTDRNKLEFECSLVYYTEGLEIAAKLKQVILFGKHKNCVGLAHNQIGGDKSVFIAKIDNKWRTFINPFLINPFIIGGNDTNYSIEDNKFEHEESCMSFPKKSNKVIRYKNIRLKHQIKARSDNNGSMWKEETFTGFNACVIQHEIDHLNGIHIFNKNEDNNNE